MCGRHEVNVAQDESTDGAFREGEPPLPEARQRKMVQQVRIPLRYGIHASIIQLVAWLLTSAMLDGGRTQGAFALASLFFWICAASLLWWRQNQTSRFDQFFLRWGLLAFVLVGTPLFRPIVEWRSWLFVVINPLLAILIVMPVLYLVVRAFGFRSPFDGEPSSSDECATEPIYGLNSQ